MSAGTSLQARVADHYFRYARAVDDGDDEAIGALVTGDVCVVRGTEEFLGRERVLALYRAHSDAPFASTHHVITNVQADRVDENTVSAQAYLTVTMVDVDGRARLLTGRYTDTFRETDGVLLLAHKHLDVRSVLQLQATVETFTGVDVSDSSRPLT